MDRIKLAATISVNRDNYLGNASLLDEILEYVQQDKKKATREEKHLLQQVDNAIQQMKDSPLLVDRKKLERVLVSYFCYHMDMKSIFECETMREENKKVYCDRVSHRRIEDLHNECETIEKLKKRIREQESKLAELERRMQGIRAVDTAAVKTQNHDNDIFLKLMTEKDDIQYSIEYMQAMIEAIKERNKQTRSFIDTLKKDKKITQI